MAKEIQLEAPRPVEEGIAKGLTYPLVFKTDEDGVQEMSTPS